MIGLVSEQPLKGETCKNKFRRHQAESPHYHHDHYKNNSAPAHLFTEQHIVTTMRVDQCVPMGRVNMARHLSQK